MSSKPLKHAATTANDPVDHKTSATQEHIGSTFSDREVHSDSVALSLDLSPDDVQQVALAIHFLSDVRAAMRQNEMGNEAETQSSSADMPAKLARYRIIRSLGRGGYAEVFLAHDDASFFRSNRFSNWLVASVRQSSTGRLHWPRSALSFRR